MSLKSVVQKGTQLTGSEATKTQSIGLELQLFVPVLSDCVAIAKVTNVFMVNEWAYYLI